MEFQPPNDDSRACRRCEHYGGVDSSGAHAVCMRLPGGQLRAMPQFGCAFFVRATGSDDDAEPVKGWKD